MKSIKNSLIKAKPCDITIVKRSGIFRERRKNTASVPNQNTYLQLVPILKNVTRGLHEVEKCLFSVFFHRHAEIQKDKY